MIIVLLSCALLLPTSSDAIQQSTFIGEWVLDSSTDPAASLTQTLRVEQDSELASGIIVSRRINGDVSTTKYLIGGSGGTIRGDGSETTVSAKWEGSHLVIRRVAYARQAWEGPPLAEHIEQWTLDSAGRLVVSVKDVPAETARSAVVFVYRRAAG